jgi:hypothetical protein
MKKISASSAHTSARSFFRTLGLCLVVGLWTLSSGAQSVSLPKDAPIKSFKIWKSEKIKRAKETVKSPKSLKDPNTYMQVKTSVDVQAAMELSVADYVVLYLSQEGSAEKFFAAAKLLDPQEVAELLRAYSDATKPAALSDLTQ